ncbi:hypothetical protein AAFB36_002158 [Enterococcus faecalis]
MKNYEKWILYGIGNFPIYILIFVQNINFQEINIFLFQQKNKTIRAFFGLLWKNSLLVLCIILIVCSLVMFRIFLSKKKENAEYSVKVIESEAMNENYLEMINSYILPLLVTNFDNINTTLSFILILVLNGLLYTRTELYRSNAFLAIVGYNLFKVKIKDTSNNEIIDAVLLTKKKGRQNNSTKKIIYLNHKDATEKTLMEV